MVAIAITLLAIDLPVPGGDTIAELWPSVQRNVGHYAAFLISSPMATTAGWAGNQATDPASHRADVKPVAPIQAQDQGVMSRNGGASIRSYARPEQRRRSFASPRTLAAHPVTAIRTEVRSDGYIINCGVLQRNDTRTRRGEHTADA